MDEQLAARVDGFGLPDHRAPGRPGRRPVRTRGAGREGAGVPGRSTTSPSIHPRPGEFAGTSCLEAAGDTQDLTAFYALVCAEAKHLGRLGDTDDYETRKAKALGIIAGRQGALELTDETTDGRTVTRRPVQTNLYVHVSLADLAAHAAGIPAVGEVEKLGPATLDLIRSWLHDSKATILPVLDLNRTDAVDRHDPPPRMREQVILRDGHCVFPWCGRDARACRPRPHRALRPTRRRRTTRPDQPTRPRAALPATPPRQDLHRLDLRTRPRRHLHLDQPPRPHLHRRTPRHQPHDAPAPAPADRRPSRGVHPRHLTASAEHPHQLTRGLRAAAPQHQRPCHRVRPCHLIDASDRPAPTRPPHPPRLPTRSTHPSAGVPT